MHYFVLHVLPVLGLLLCALLICYGFIHRSKTLEQMTDKKKQERSEKKKSSDKPEREIKE